MSNVSNKINFLFLLSITVMFANCIVVTEEEKLFFKKNNKIDTIPPFGPLEIVFSEEISDTITPQFQFSPSFYSFTISSSKKHDTFYIKFPEPLDGEKKYVIRVSQPIFSNSGATMYPMDDSLVFITLPLEKEPNNNFELADTLTKEISGTFSDISDQDCYVISYKTEKLVISPVECIVTFQIYDIEKKFLFIKEEIDKNDTITLSNPNYIYLILKPSLKEAGGYYILKNLYN